METTHISCVHKQFKYYKSLGDKTFEQLTFEELNYQPHEDSNSISIIVKHMVGNMLSRWTNFLTEDGEKAWRERDKEFEASYTTKQQLTTEWEKGWKCLFEAIESLEDRDFETIIFIRNEGHTAAEAMFRQLGHYSYHVGQITYLGKLIKESQWKSLSIPKLNSSTYNSEKFSKPKGRRHFTDDV